MATYQIDKLLQGGISYRKLPDQLKHYVYNFAKCAVFKEGNPSLLMRNRQFRLTNTYIPCDLYKALKHR